MNPPKVRDEDYINFIIATPHTVTATEASSCQPESRQRPSHDAFTRLLSRLEPDPEVLWTEAQTQIDLNRGILVLDDSTLEKPYSPFNDLLYRHWSGKQKAVVEGINLITLLWTDGVRCVPVDYRVFDCRAATVKPKTTILPRCPLKPTSVALIPNWFVSIAGMLRLRISNWCALWAGIF